MKTQKHWTLLTNHTDVCFNTPAYALTHMKTLIPHIHFIRIEIIQHSAEVTAWPWLLSRLASSGGGLLRPHTRNVLKDTCRDSCCHDTVSLCLILLISARTKCLRKHATLIYSFMYKTDVKKRHERTRALSLHPSPSDHKERRSIRFCVYGNSNSTNAGLVQITIQHCSRKHSRRSASVNAEGGIEQLYGCQHKRAVKVLCAAPRWDETEASRSSHSGGGRFCLGWIQFRIFELNLHIESPTSTSG